MRYDMANRMRGQMMDMLDQLETINVADLPNYRMMVLLRKAMIDRGLPVDFAERMVSKMEISVGETAIEDEELIDRCVDAFSSTVHRMRHQIERDFESRGDEILENMAKQFKLTLEW